MPISIERPVTAESPQSYIIVGAGVFGASTALHLKRTKPLAKVILIDSLQPNPAAASFDLNKIIRADYRDVFYMKLALEAQYKWRNDPLYKPYFHQTGMLFAENSDKGPAFLRNYAALGVSTPAVLMTVDEARRAFPALANGNWQGVKRAYFNPDSGWGNSEPALQAVVNAAVTSGVEFRLGTVEKLLIRRSSSSNDKNSQSSLQCTGVRLRGGVEIQANHVLLCTGAATSKLLADSAPTEANFQSAGRLVAAAAMSCTVRVDPKKWHLYDDAPVFANLMSHTTGEAIPLNDEGLLKFNYELSFTNNEPHLESGQIISCPPDSIAACIWRDDVPQLLKDEALKLVRGTYGPMTAGLEVESYRICWDCITESQDWIISPHDFCSRLFIATGGSFHAWKFLPVLGSNIVDMMDGKLCADKANRWAWTPKHATEGGACDSYIPKRDMKDILAQEKVKSRV